jgi:transcriptional regulator with XRE-family HTH domain
MNYKKLNDLIRENNLTQNKAAAAFGVSSPGLREMIDNKTMKVETLEKIAKYFNVPVSYFFDEDPCNELNEPPATYNKAQIICPLCAEKDRIINLLEMHRDDLRRELGFINALGKKQA